MRETNSINGYRESCCQRGDIYIYREYIERAQREGLWRERQMHRAGERERERERTPKQRERENERDEKDRERERDERERERAREQVEREREVRDRYRRR